MELIRKTSRSSGDHDPVELGIPEFDPDLVDKDSQSDDYEDIDYGSQEKEA